MAEFLKGIQPEIISRDQYDGLMSGKQAVDLIDLSREIIEVINETSRIRLLV